MVSSLRHGAYYPDMIVYIHAPKEKRMKLEPSINKGTFCGIQKVLYGY
jgi:hypothetical protein